jgi:hypothetical protein
MESVSPTRQRHMSIFIKNINLLINLFIFLKMIENPNTIVDFVLLQIYFFIFQMIENYHFPNTIVDFVLNKCNYP